MKTAEESTRFIHKSIGAHGQFSPERGCGNAQPQHIGTRQRSVQHINASLGCPRAAAGAAHTAALQPISHPALRREMQVTNRTVGLATFGSPSPRPSPSGRGRTVHRLSITTVTEFAQQLLAKHSSEARGSLSLRERVRVRGKYSVAHAACSISQGILSKPWPSCRSDFWLN